MPHNKGFCINCGKISARGSYDPTVGAFYHRCHLCSYQWFETPYGAVYGGEYKFIENDVTFTEAEVQKTDSRSIYEKNLRERQREHLAQVHGNSDWRPCMHDSCTSCVGTGIKSDGSMCVHMISCPCPRCSPW